MARSFDDASSQYLEVDSAPATAPPLSIACWVYMDDAGAGSPACLWLGDKDSSGDWFAIRYSDPASDFFYSIKGTVTVNLAGTVDAGTGSWHHVCGVSAAVDDHRFYTDGGDKQTDGTSVTVATPDRVSIGRLGDSDPSGYLPGDVAEVAIWNAALTDAEVAILGLGYSPLLVRPQSLVAYWPLIRDTDDDIVGGYSMTPNGGPTVAAHTRVIYPAHQTVKLLSGACVTTVTVTETETVTVVAQQ